MTVQTGAALQTIVDFVLTAVPPARARARAADAIRDTIGVTLAGVGEPATCIVHEMCAAEGRGDCRILGTPHRTSPGFAAMANGAAAHALDYDDMCFVSLAHPSCVLVPAILAAGEVAHSPGSVLTDAYVVGFELECRLGQTMNPRHYHARGWHATSSIGTLGAAAAAARVLGLDAAAAAHAIAIAASAACGLKENMGTMVKPLHAAMAARNGVMAVRLAQAGFTASPRALDGPQGYLVAMDSQERSLEPHIADLGTRWEILDTGITVKLYPSCAATHPPLDVLVDMKRRERIDPEQVERVEVEVDSMTPRLLLYPRPSTGLEAKFSMPFCAAAALVHGRLGVETFDEAHIQDPAVQRLMPRVTLRANPAFDPPSRGASAGQVPAPLSRTRVTVRLKDGRVLTEDGQGARGYPGRVSQEELAAKFRDCASRALTPREVDRAWDALASFETLGDVRELTASFTGTSSRPQQ